MKLIINVVKNYYLTEYDKGLIKSWVKENEMTLKEVAKEFGIAYKYFLHILGGRRPIPKDYIDYFISRGVELKRTEYELE